MKYIVNTLIGLVLLSSGLAHAQTHLGNPLDKIPEINLNKGNAPKVSIEKNKPQEIEIKKDYLYIQKFNIQGVKSVEFKEVAAIFENLSHKEIQISDLTKAANEVTEIYKKQGYLLSFAYVPQQNFSNSTAQIVIVEGYIKEFTITGKTQYNENRISDILNSLKEDKPLKKETFERVTGILALQPGIKVDLKIPTPTTIEGGVISEANIVQKKLDVTLSLEAGNPEFQAIIAASINSLTPLGDQLTLLTLQPSGDKDKKFYGVNYAVPLGSKGAFGRVSITDYKEQPEVPSLTNFGYNAKYLSESQRLSVAATVPLILKNDKNWTVGGGLYLNKESQTYIPQSETFPNLEILTKSSVIYGETNFVEAKNKQFRQINASLYKGIKTFGARTESRITDLDFVKLKLQATQNYTLDKNFNLKFSGVYQYSNDNLPSSEKISFGNRLYGSAYQAGEITGDKGWGVSSELSYTKKTDYKYLKTIEPYLLLEKSKTFSNSEISRGGKLSSASIGARLYHLPHYSLNLLVSKPLGKEPTDGHDTRYYISYTYKF